MTQHESDLPPTRKDSAVERPGAGIAGAIHPDPKLPISKPAPSRAQGGFKRLGAVAAVAVGTAAADAFLELSAAPIELARELASSLERQQDLSPEARLHFLQVMATDPRPEVRVLVPRCLAGTVATLDGAAEGMMDSLSSDEDSRVRQALASALGRILPRLSSLESAGLVARWATSPDARQRHVVAQALLNQFPVLWHDEVLTHLASDPSPRVRRAARRAALRRGVDLSGIV